MSQTQPKDPFNGFDPNKPEASNFPWATYFPTGRVPKFKLHKQRSHALSTFAHHGNGILYKWDSAQEKWIEIFRCDWLNRWQKDSGQHPRYCKICGADTMKSYAQGQTYFDGKAVWNTRLHLPQPEPLALVWLCHNCRGYIR